MSTHCTAKLTPSFFFFFLLKHMVVLDVKRGNNNKRHFTFSVKNHEICIFLFIFRAHGNGGKMAVGWCGGIRESSRVKRTENSSSISNKCHEDFIRQVVGKRSWRLSEFDRENKKKKTSKVPIIMRVDIILIDISIDYSQIPASIKQSYIRLPGSNALK